MWYFDAMRKTFALSALVVTGLSLPLACKSPAHENQSTISEPKSNIAPSQWSLLFKLQAIAAKDPGVQQWLATYTSRGKTALFRIELSLPQGGSNKAMPILFGTGRFLSEPTSDSSAMLADLQKVLDAKSIPKGVKREANLSFTYATLGEHQSRFKDGSLSSKPPGNWNAMKIFINTGNEESEVFMNLNSVDGEGEFSMKDPDYGDAILRKFAGIF